MQAAKNKKFVSDETLAHGAVHKLAEILETLRAALPELGLTNKPFSLEFSRHSLGSSASYFFEDTAPDAGPNSYLRFGREFKILGGKTQQARREMIRRSGGNFAALVGPYARRALADLAEDMGESACLTRHMSRAVELSESAFDPAAAFPGNPEMQACAKLFRKRFARGARKAKLSLRAAMAQASFQAEDHLRRFKDETPGICEIHFTRSEYSACAEFTLERASEPGRACYGPTCSSYPLGKKYGSRLAYSLGLRSGLLDPGKAASQIASAITKQILGELCEYILERTDPDGSSDFVLASWIRALEEGKSIGLSAADPAGIKAKTKAL